MHNQKKLIFTINNNDDVINTKIDSSGDIKDIELFQVYRHIEALLNEMDFNWAKYGTVQIKYNDKDKSV